MNTLLVEGWCKMPGVEHAVPVEGIRFRISEACHLDLEAAEEELRRTHAPETVINVDTASMELQLPEGFAPLADCRLRVYLGPLDSRGQFHLVGHRASDNALVYTNAVMVDQLG